MNADGHVSENVAVADLNILNLGCVTTHVLIVGNFKLVRRPVAKGFDSD